MFRVREYNKNFKNPSLKAKRVASLGVFFFKSRKYVFKVKDLQGNLESIQDSFCFNVQQILVFEIILSILIMRIKFVCSKNIRKINKLIAHLYRLN